MWIVSTPGFVSIIVGRDDKDILVVRSRDRESLEPFVDRLRAAPDLVVIEHTPTADYAYRVRVPREVVAEVVAEAVRHIRYDNVKTAVARSRGVKYGTVLNDAWVVFKRLEEPEPPMRKRNGNGRGRAR
jgi:hypothetical protein